MSQHRQDIPTEPSWWWIVLYSLAGVATLWVVLAVIAADTWTWVHLAAVLFGLFTAAVFAGLSGHKVLQRGEARIAAVKREVRERERAHREHEERARNTGTWRGDAVGQVLTVRWDAASRTYLVQGWLSDFWVQREERPWPDLDTLASTLAELEATELRPLDDEGTRAVRARLDLPGWDDPEADSYPQDPDPVATQPIPSGPSPAALRPIGVPVLRPEPGPEDTAVIRWTDAGLPRREPGAGLQG